MILVYSINKACKKRSSVQQGHRTTRDVTHNNIIVRLLSSLTLMLNDALVKSTHPQNKLGSMYYSHVDS